MKFKLKRIDWYIIKQRHPHSIGGISSGGNSDLRKEIPSNERCQARTRSSPCVM